MQDLKRCKKCNNLPGVHYNNRPNVDTLKEISCKSCCRGTVFRSVRDINNEALIREWNNMNAD